MAIKRNMDDMASRNFWEHVDRTSEEVSSWTQWQRSRRVDPEHAAPNSASERERRGSSENKGLESPDDEG